MAINISIKKGDIIFTGRFRNRRTEVEKFGEDDWGQPLVNGQRILKIRIEKLIPKSKRPKVKESIKEIIKEELKSIFEDKQELGKQIQKVSAHIDTIRKKLGDSKTSEELKARLRKTLNKATTRKATLQKKMSS